MDYEAIGDSLRRRNISWPETINHLAEELAYRHRMDVGELLARLVFDARNRKRVESIDDSTISAAKRVLQEAA